MDSVIVEQREIGHFGASELQHRVEDGPRQFLGGDRGNEQDLARQERAIARYQRDQLGLRRERVRGHL